MSTTSPSQPNAEAGLWREALAWSIGLSALFLIAYGGTSWITSLRTDVGTWYYAWERFIPFVPLMIVPYMSIDLFFVAAPFVCRSRRELRILAGRIIMALVVASLCFLIYPLQLAVERPAAGGWLGPIWEWFKGMDRPYNLLPSLHIALRTILAVVYVQHTRGLLRLATNVWFSLIGLSTLLTYQHHTVDVIGGFILALFCFYFVSEAPLRLPMVRNPRIAWIYVGLGGLMLLLCAATWPWGSILVWPLVSVALVIAAYVWLGPGIFRKQGGRLPLSARIVLGPVLAGQHLSLLYYKRQCRPWDAIAPNVWIGRRLSDAEAAQAVQEGVTAVVDLTGEFAEAEPFLNVRYLNLPVLDLTAPTQEQLTQAVAFIQQESARGTVYLHCKIGYSRTAGAAGAWLLAAGLAKSVDEAVGLLRAARPSIVIRPEIVTGLREFARSGARGLQR